VINSSELCPTPRVDAVRSHTSCSTSSKWSTDYGLREAEGAPPLKPTCVSRVSWTKPCFLCVLLAYAAAPVVERPVNGTRSRPGSPTPHDAAADPGPSSRLRSNASGTGAAAAPATAEEGEGDAGGEAFWGQWPRPRPLQMLAGHVSRVTALLFSHDGHSLLSASQDGSLRVSATPCSSAVHELDWFI
jgi:WD40 repeat protein